MADVPHPASLLKLFPICPVDTPSGTRSRLPRLGVLQGLSGDSSHPHFSATHDALTALVLSSHLMFSGTIAARMCEYLTSPRHRYEGACLNRTTLIATFVMATLIGTPVISFTEASGGSGGYSGSSGIGHMLFGATSSYAQTTDGDVPAAETTPLPATPDGSSSAGILLILLLLGAATIFYFLKIQRPSLPDFSGITGRNPSVDKLPKRRSSVARQKLSVDSVTSADKAAFQQLLIDVQRAWSKQDLTELRQFVTPEMLNYFSAALADNTSQDIQNHVEDVVLLRAEILEVWTEQATHYVTTGLRWSARDYNLSLTKQRGEPGYVVEGNEKTPTEAGEAWTFMQSPDGKWLLSTIQQ